MRTTLAIPPPRKARPPVLVLVGLQRLERQARGRLGKRPAGVRRRRRRRRSIESLLTSATARTAGVGGLRLGRRASRGRRRHATVVYLESGLEREQIRCSAPAWVARPRLGVGCDDTSGPSVEVRPGRANDPERSGRRPSDLFPWIAFEGRWGELQRAFFNGPTGPEPEDVSGPSRSAWSADWRDRSYAVPAGGALGTRTTDFFCSAIAAGSNALRRLVDDPLPVLLALGTLLVLVLFGLSRATWRPTAPLRLARRRAWGQILTAAARMYARRALVVPRHRPRAAADLVRRDAPAGDRHPCLEHRGDRRPRARVVGCSCSSSSRSEPP